MGACVGCADDPEIQEAAGRGRRREALQREDEADEEEEEEGAEEEDGEEVEEEEEEEDDNERALSADRPGLVGGTVEGKEEEEAEEGEGRGDTVEGSICSGSIPFAPR